MSLTPAGQPRARLAVLASGGGSNLQAIIDACADGRIAAEVGVVVTDRPAAHAVVRAANAGIPSVVLAPAPAEPRADYDTRLAAAVAGYDPQWVILAGWMRLLTMSFLGPFANRVVNLHPALPGEFPGTKAIERAFADSRSGVRRHTGVMVHLVPDEGVDDGPVLGTSTVAIHPDDDIDALRARVHAAEHDLLVEVVASLVSGD